MKLLAKTFHLNGHAQDFILRLKSNNQAPPDTVIHSCSERVKCNFFFNFSLTHTYTLDVAHVYVTSPVQLTDCKVLSLTDLSGGEK